MMRSMKKLRHSVPVFLGKSVKWMSQIIQIFYGSYFNLGGWFMFDLAHFVGENRWLFEGVECSLLDLKAYFLSTLNAL